MPTWAERYGSDLLSSVMGSASMSERSAMVEIGPLAGGPQPLMSTTRPVVAHVLIAAGSIPASSLSTLRRKACVFTSLKAVSGCECRCRRMDAIVE